MSSEVAREVLERFKLAYSLVGGDAFSSCVYVVPARHITEHPNEYASLGHVRLNDDGRLATWHFACESRYAENVAVFQAAACYAVASLPIAARRSIETTTPMGGTAQWMTAVWRRGAKLPNAYIERGNPPKFIGGCWQNPLLASLDLAQEWAESPDGFPELQELPPAPTARQLMKENGRFKLGAVLTVRNMPHLPVGTGCRMEIPDRFFGPERFRPPYHSPDTPSPGWVNQEWHVEGPESTVAKAVIGSAAKDQVRQLQNRLRRSSQLWAVRISKQRVRVYFASESTWRTATERMPGQRKAHRPRRK